MLPAVKLESGVLLALPPDKVTVLPKFTPLVLNWTAPVGVPLPGVTAPTVAVNVTACPDTEGLTDEATVVLLPALLTVWLSAVELLVLKLASPPYTAVIECEVTLRELLVKVAWPELSVPVPKVAAPSLNVTVPPGIPLPGATGLTVAVNVTGWPDTDGVTEEPTATVVPAALTVWLSAEEVLELKLVSPP